MSHTIKVKLTFQKPDALGRAVQAMGGQVLGQGQHAMWRGRPAVQGLGFRLAGSCANMVLPAPGQDLAIDSMDARMLPALEKAYAVQVARETAEAQGWYCELQPNGDLLVYADGGTLTVTGAGTVDASGYTGGSCVAPTELLAAAMGGTVSSQAKPEQTHLVQAQSVQEAD